MIIRDTNERREKIDALATRYRNGEFSTTVFQASLFAAGMRLDDIRTTVDENQKAFQQSLPFKRGELK